MISVQMRGFSDLSSTEEKKRQLLASLNQKLIKGGIERPDDIDFCWGTSCLNLSGENSNSCIIFFNQASSGKDIVLLKEVLKRECFLNGRIMVVQSDNFPIRKP